MGIKLVKGYEMGKLFVERHKLSGKQALDIGAGYVAHTLAFAEHFDKVDALDITDIRFNKKALRKISPAVDKINFVKMDAHKIDSLNKKYNLIYTLSTFEHLADWKKVMSLIPNLLSKNGLFYLVISPLYYSELGHHLRPFIGDWEHLIIPEKDLKKKLYSKCVKEIADFAWQNYKELNKLTGAGLITEMRKYFNQKYLKIDKRTIEYLGQIK